MLKKIIFTTLVIFTLVSLAIWSPWEEYDLTIARFFGVEEIEKVAGLELYSLKGNLELYLDDEYKGKISPEDGFLPVGDIIPGSHIVRITRESNPENAYHEITKSINFIESLNVVIAYELGPTEEFSQGHIFYARNSEENIDTETAKLNVYSNNLENIEVFLNNKKIGETPINNFDLSLETGYVLTLKKDGYEELSFSILPEDHESRNELMGVDLYIEADLFWIPQEIIQEK